MKVCPSPGCPELVTPGEDQCPLHRGESHRRKAKRRGTFRQRGYDAEYQRNRARVLAEETHCWLCGEPVDKALKAPDPRSPSADHVKPGNNDRSNLRLAHLGCNSSRGARGWGATPSRIAVRPPVSESKTTHESGDRPRVGSPRLN